MILNHIPSPNTLPTPALSPLTHISSESVVRALASISHYLGPKLNHLTIPDHASTGAGGTNWADTILHDQG